MTTTTHSHKHWTSKGGHVRGSQPWEQEQFTGLCVDANRFDLAVVGGKHLLHSFRHDAPLRFEPQMSDFAASAHALVLRPAWLAYCG